MGKINDQSKITDKMILEALKEMSDEARCAGLLHAVLRGPDGKIIDDQLIPNQFQTLGKQHVADRLADVGEVAMGWMGIGTGTGRGVGDNTLANAAGAGAGARQALDGGTPTHSANVVTYHRAFAAGQGTGTITEAGVFNNATVGDMMLYNDGITFAKGAGDALTLTWTFTVN